MKVYSNIKFLSIIYLIICIMLFSGCSYTSSAQTANVSGNELVVSYINVGQADSILIQSPDGKNMLIDAGETIDGAIKGYLNERGIKRLDTVIATHPHADHISEMADIINTYEIGNFYMPNAQSTTKSFEKMLTSLSNKGVKPTLAKAGMSFTLGNEVMCNILAPCSDSYDEINDYSIVLKLSYGKNSFIFTGDAEALSEKEIINKGTDLNADVLKIGHHGSSTSTCKEFLKRVSPEYAVISCGKDNDYGHPHKETIATLSGIKTYITKDSGTIVITSDSKNIKVNASPTSEVATEKNISNTYVGNKNSLVYHTDNCSSLPSEKNRISFSSIQEAESNGYKPHKVCIN